MRKKAMVVLLGLAGAFLLQGHTLFLKLNTYFLKPHSSCVVALFNGTFQKSENHISRDRIADATIVLPGGQRIHPQPSWWRDRDSQTEMVFRTGEPGTYVVGVSIKPNLIRLTADQFNEYLEHDGLPDILQLRKKEGKLHSAARERYSKHVKAILQVGERRTETYATPLNYPVEIIPLVNPYELSSGDLFSARILKFGKPLAGQLVFASYDSYRPGNGNEEAVSIRSDSSGVIRFTLSAKGRWYVRLINMVEVHEKDVDYESNWATLTFEVR